MSFSNQGFYEDHEKSEIHEKKYAKYKEAHQIKFTEPPVVFVTVMEHNSNYLPWYEKDKDIIIEFINLDLETGEINYKELEDILRKYQSYNGLKIGTFSAGSNITGILNDVDYISYLMHKAGGLCFIDYAAAAPYVDINVNGKTDRFSRVSQEEAHL